MVQLNFKNSRVYTSISATLLLLTTIPVLAGGPVSAQESSAYSITAYSANDESGEVVAASGSNRFVVWTDETLGNFEIFFRRSTDNGATWKPTVNLSNNPGGSVEVQLAVSASSVFVIWNQYDASGDVSDVLFRRSGDNGATWKPVVNISEKNAGDAFNPVIEALGTDVVIVWADTTLNSEILLKRSGDGGTTWGPIVNVSNDTPGSYDPQVTLFGSNIYVVWQGYRSGNLDIFLRKSPDHGATWKSTFNISKGSPASYEPLVAVASSNVYVVWREGGETFLRRSTDGGATWKSSQNISNDGGSSLYHLIAASGNNLYIAWKLDGGSNDIILRRSTDNGATWKTKVNISDSAGDSYPSSLEVAGSKVYVAWTESTGDLFVRRSVDGGATWKSKTNVGDAANNVSVAHVFASGSNVYAAWIQPDEMANGEIYFSRSTDSGATWQMEKNLSNNNGGSIYPKVAG